MHGIACRRASMLLLANLIRIKVQFQIHHTLDAGELIVSVLEDACLGR